jgi:hypothetical protein
LDNVRRAIPLLIVAVGCSTFEASDDAVDAGTDTAITAAERPCIATRADRPLCEDFETDKSPSFGFTDAIRGPRLVTARVPSGKGFALSYRDTLEPTGAGWFRFDANAGHDLGFKALTLSMDVEILSQSFTYGELAGFWIYGISPATIPQELGINVTTVPTGGTHAVALRLEKNGNMLTLRISVDGVQKDTKTATLTALESAWDARVGMYYSSGGSIDMKVDNVMVVRE